MEHRVRFELTILRICNPLHWAALPPVHCLLEEDNRIELSPITEWTGFQVQLGSKPSIFHFYLVTTYMLLNIYVWRALEDSNLHVSN